ncbi:MAG: TldD/PmbA family protein [Bacteroidales bacterium]|nr:TldD/PmbA family protein [Bacteroidales bacterium]
MKTEEFKAHFSVGEEDLDSVVASALSRGGDYADLYFEDTVKSVFRLTDSKVTSGGLYSDYGVGIRTLSAEKTGYAYCADTVRRRMIETARTAALIASSDVKYHYHTPAHAIPDAYPQTDDWNDFPPEKAVAFLQELEAAIRGRDSRAGQISIYLETVHSDILMYNSLGELRCDSRPMLELSVTSVFSRGSEKISQSSSRSYRLGSEALTKQLISDLADTLTRNLDDRFNARRPKGGQMSVVMGKGASGILLHEAMGHAFEADFNITRESVFSDKMGQRVAPEGVNIVDDGTLHADRGACRYDDEGIEGQKTYMVRDGILCSYLHDRLSAARFGVQPTGNGRRENYTCAPLPRMRDTYMEAGTASPEDIIASLHSGIYVDDFSNGQVKIGEGDFTFYVRSGYLIENGRLTTPIKDINIIGNGPEALADIRAVGNDLSIPPLAWTCGKGQSVPVSCGIPTVCIGNLTVGGE